MEGLNIENDVDKLSLDFQVIKLQNEVDNKIIAPIKEAEYKGILKILLSNETIASVPLLAKKSISKGSIFNRLKDEIHLMLFD